MALPAVVTVGSLAFVVAAAAGYVVSSTASAEVAGPTRHAVVHPQQPQSQPQPPSTTHTRPTHKPPPHPKADVVPSVLVVLFNNTGVTGVAERKAAILRGAGWNVAATDNWYGNIPADTVYYPPGLQADAIELARVLHIARLHTAVAPMQFDRLTVILVSS